jgi:imidazolonepropionase
VNAAYSVNRGDKIGSLEPGKLGNFVILDCGDYREVAYWFGMPQTHAVFVRGQCAAEL